MVFVLVFVLDPPRGIGSSRLDVAVDERQRDRGVAASRAERLGLLRYRFIRLARP
ncbi:hypothetical protein [Micromonospora lupini]|uniref:hypothetical protein n=1 Tax=Micromonospora lupini TaxID=285679 RepID=UPI0031E42ACF